MNLRRPITPATTGPVSIPIRTASQSRPVRAAIAAISSRIASAIRATASRWSGRGSGNPPATM
jgi:hypothetical protein